LEKKTTKNILESYNDRCIKAEQNLLEAQQIIAALESNVLLLKHENEKNLKDIEGMLKCTLIYPVPIKNIEKQAIRFLKYHLFV